jgi:hypothetical protein
VLHARVALAVVALASVQLSCGADNPPEPAPSMPCVPGQQSSCDDIPVPEAGDAVAEAGNDVQSLPDADRPDALEDASADASIDSLDGGADSSPTDAISEPEGRAEGGTSLGLPAIGCGTQWIDPERGTEVVDLGHADTIVSLSIVGGHALSADAAHHWVLWNVPNRAGLVRGNAPCSRMYPGGACSAYAVPQLAGSTLLVPAYDVPAVWPYDGGFQGGVGHLEVRSATTGQVLSQVPSSSLIDAGLASDGTYVWSGGTDALDAWTLEGQPVLHRPGDYSHAIVFAAPGELRIALGPAGDNVVELVSVPSGTSVSSPFSGSFHSWFLDGGRFLTMLGNNVWVYSKAGAQDALVALPSVEHLTGQGDYFWTFEQYTLGYPLRIYNVAAPQSPSATLNLGVGAVPIPSGDTIGWLPYGTPAFKIVHLDATGVTTTDQLLPFAYPSAYGSDADGHWVVGNDHGVLLDDMNAAKPAPNTLGCGAALSIAGSSAGTTTVATAAKTILVQNEPSSPPAWAIPFGSSHVELTSDGSVLAASADTTGDQYMPDRSLKLFALQTNAEINTWSYADPSGPALFDFSLARGGTRVGRVTGTWDFSTWSYTRSVTDLTGSSQIWTDTGSGDRINLSPNGTLIAVSEPARSQASTTRIYKNGALINAVAGYAVGWLDDDRLLVNTYLNNTYGNVYSGSVIYDAAGYPQSSPPIPEMFGWSTVATTQMYSQRAHKVYDLVTGVTTWQDGRPSPDNGVVSGGCIVFAQGPVLMAEPVCPGCVSSCTDGVRNGDETGVDCGGNTCPPCGLDVACVGRSDCASHSCVGGTCAGPG